MIRIFALLLLTFCSTALLAQENQDAITYFQNGEYKQYLESIIQQSKGYEDDDKAALLLREALEKTRVPLANDTTFAEAYHRLGIHHYYLDQEHEAIAAWENAIQIRAEVFPPHHVKIIKGYRNIGNSYVALNELDNAQVALQQALDLNLENPATDTSLLADLYRELGYIFSEQEDTKKADTYLTIAQNLCEKVYPDNPWELAQMYDYRYLHEKRKQNAEQMIFFIEKSLKQLEAIQDKDTGDIWRIANNYNNLAIAYELLKDDPKAQVYYTKSLETNENYKADRKIEITQNYANLIGVYHRQGLLQEAKQSAAKALAIAEQLDNPSLHSLVLHNRAEMYGAQKAYAKALKDYQQSIQLLVPAFRSDDFFDNPSSTSTVLGNKPSLIISLDDKAVSLHELSKVEKTTTYLEASVLTYDTIAQFIDQVRLDFESDESKAFLTNQAKIIFERAIQTNLDLYAQSKNTTYLKNAFNFVERSKAVILLDAIKENQAKISANIPADLLERERTLRGIIQDIEQELLNTPEEQKESIRSVLVTTNRQLERLIDTLENEYASYHALKYSTAITDLEQVQAELLRPNQAMIQYFVGEEKMYIFYIPKSGRSSAYTLPLDFPLADWIEGLRTGIYGKYTTPQQGETDLDKAYCTHAWQLYEKLLQPIQEELAPQLILVPDGILGYIPFDALLTKTVPETEYAQYYSHPYLVRQHQLSYTYSATLLHTMNEMAIAPTYNKVLAFAPSFGEGAASNNRGSVVDSRTGLSPLLHNKREVEAVQKLWGGESIYGAAATKQRFLDLATDYSYLHLSSHARMNDEQPDYSYIAFTQASNKALDEDELLFVGDLYNTPLNADMVVLSACETGLGKLNKGEGIISLARAFSYAGARSVITTLWRVNDQETANLMIDFYEQLQTGKSKDEALWLAKKRFLDEGIHPHPYYWAGFTPIGSMNALEVSTFQWWWLVLLSLIGLLVLLFLKKRSR